MICEQMKNIVYYMKTALDNELRKYNITATQFIVLEYLLENENNVIIQKDVCEYLVLKHSTVIGIMQRLESKGLIKKETSHWSIITITDKGKKLIERVGDRRGFVEKTLLNGFDKKEIKTISNQLDIMYKNIKNNI